MATQFSGGTYVDATFTGAVKSDLQINIAAQLVTAGWTSIAIGAGLGPGNAGTVTISQASPGIVTFNTHGFLGNEKIIFQTTGALPAPLAINTLYFVTLINANTFSLSTTINNANPVNTTNAGSGTHTLNAQSYLLQSATQTYVTYPILVRLKDNAASGTATSCIQVSIENQAGSVVGTNTTSQAGNLLPAVAKTFEVIATKYHFMCFRQGGQAAREFVMAGMLFIPSFVTDITDMGYMFADSDTDTGTTIYPTFRNGVTFGNQNNQGTLQFIWNSNIWDFKCTNSVSGGIPQALITTFYRSGSDGTVGSYRWENGDLMTSDVLCSAGLSNRNDEAKIKGQFYDMIYISSAFTIDVTDTFNSHNWHNITNNNAGTANTPSGGIWVATS